MGVDGHTTEQPAQRPAGRWATVVLGSLVSVLGLAGLARHGLAHPAPWLERAGAMHPLAAVCLVVLGTGLMAAGRRHRRVSVAAGAIAGALGTLALLDFMLDVHLVEALLGRWIRAASRAASPLHPNTSLCIALTGVSLLIVGSPAARQNRALVLGLFGSIDLIFASLAFLGAFTPLETVYGWGQLTSIGVPSAAGLSLLGIAVLASAWRESQHEGADMVRWLPFGAGMAILTVTACLAFALLQRDRAQVELMTAIELTNLKIRMAAEVESRVLALVRLGRQWERETTPRHEHLEADARLLIQHAPGLQAIAWREPGSGTASTIPSEAAHWLSDDDLAPHVVRLSRREEPRILLTPSLPLAGQDLGVAALIRLGDHPAPRGVLVGVFRLRTLLDSMLVDWGPRFSVRLLEGDKEIYRRYAAQDPAPGEPSRTATLDLFGSSWTLHVWPRPALPASMRTGLPEVVFVVGALVAILMVLVISFAQRARLRARQRELAYRELQAEVVERARVQAELGHSHRALRESHAELKATQLRLIQAAKLESVGQLAAGVAHEVKNPLGTILLGIEFLKTHHPPENELAATMLADMETAVFRADAVARGLLDFAAPRDVTLATGSLNDVAEEALAMVRADLVKSRVATTAELSPSLAPVLLDRQKLLQVLVNLFINAIHAMATGGTITIRTEMRTRADDDPEAGRRTDDFPRAGQPFVVLTVDDTGTGIPEDTLARMFDPFFTTKPTGQGTGLGLSVSKKIMDLHHGTIAFENRSEGGARATLMFPTHLEEDVSWTRSASSSSTTRRV